MSKLLAVRLSNAKERLTPFRFAFYYDSIIHCSMILLNSDQLFVIPKEFVSSSPSFEKADCKGLGLTPWGVLEENWLDLAIWLENREKS